MKSYFLVGDNCAGNGAVYEYSEGTLSSPNYPNLYPNGFYCNWTISSTKLVVITILEFLTETCCDHLYVSKSSDVVVK